MRNSEEMIKGALLHPEAELRNRAVRYFADSYSTDSTIMPMVIEAIEKYGRSETTCMTLSMSRDLAQTDATIDWIVAELNGDACEKYDYASNLAHVIEEADVGLLVPRESAILSARRFPKGRRAQELKDRIAMRDWDESKCWQKLDEVCERLAREEKDAGNYFKQADGIVEALSRFAPNAEERILRELAPVAEGDGISPAMWREIYLVQLAGLVRLESAIPLLIAKLARDDGDFLNEGCQESLSRIGTPAVVRAIAEAFPNETWSFKLFSSTPLIDIHCDESVEACLQLLKDETEADIRDKLIEALLVNFAPEGIDLAWRELKGADLHFGNRGMRDDLVENCLLTGARFPDYETWLSEYRLDKAESARRTKQFAPLLAGMLSGQEPLAASPPKPAREMYSPPVAPLLQKAKTVGRNDPCPCKSGKKFKQCCMKKQGGY